MKNIFYNIIKKYKVFEKLLTLIILIICYFLLKNIYNFSIFSLFSFFSFFSLKNFNLEREGFEWSQSEKDEFIMAQSINNPKIIYDLEQLQKYANRDEVGSFLETGLWPWSDKTQQLYVDALETNPYVRIYKTSGLNQARKIYNESAILFILKNQNENIKYLNSQIEGQTENEIENEKNGFGDYGYRPTIIA